MTAGHIGMESVKEGDCVKGMVQRIRQIATVLLICIICGTACVPAAAETQETTAPIELMPFIGRPSNELSKAVGGCYGIEYSQQMTIWSDTVYAYVTVERGAITGWPDDYTFLIFLTTEDHCLDGYRVGDSFADAKARALSEGWTLVGEEGGELEVRCEFEKVIGEAVYTLEMQSDYRKSVIDYITMSAIHAAQMEKALEEAAEYEAANLSAFGGNEEGFVFRNGVTWESTAEEIMLSEEEEYSHLYEAEGWQEIFYSYASGLWYRPSLSYSFLMSETVNMIQYRYNFGSSEDEYWQDLLMLLNGQFGESAELDRERFDRLYGQMQSGEAELYGNWSLDDGTYITLCENGSGISVLYFKEDELLAMIETLTEAGA